MRRKAMRQEQQLRLLRCPKKVPAASHRTARLSGGPGKCRRLYGQNDPEGSFFIKDIFLTLFLDFFKLVLGTHPHCRYSTEWLVGGAKETHKKDEVTRLYVIHNQR